MSEIEIESNIEQVAKILEKLPLGIRLETHNRLQAAAEETFQEILTRTPIRTGFLKSRNYMREIDPLTFAFGNDAEYAGFVHDGTSRVPARPFILSAIRDKLGRITQQIIEGLEKVAKNLPR